MPSWRSSYYYYDDNRRPPKEKLCFEGYCQLDHHDIFHDLLGDVIAAANKSYGKDSAAVVDKSGKVYVNTSISREPHEWAHIIAHCLLHLAFGHFDKDKMPENVNINLWNKACDIYVERFLRDIKFGKPICNDPAENYSIKLNDEKKIYEHLCYLAEENNNFCYGTNGNTADMIGLEHPNVYKNGETNEFADAFSDTINGVTSYTVCKAGSHDMQKRFTSKTTKARDWFLTHYPLFGGLAASFKIIEDIELCHKYEIHIAAVDIPTGEIYVNPSAKLSEDEWKFVLAHEYLHAGLEHHKRCLGRDPYLWNIACDYVVNDWLVEMKIGKMPEENLLYDKELHGCSAEEIYDLILKEIRKYKKLSTFRGFGHGDIMKSGIKSFDTGARGVSLDEFFKNALKEGLDFHSTNNRGYLPAGLVEEIKALSEPPIPWEVELGRWFDYRFSPIHKHRSYARPSRRQASSPNIPRPRYTMMEENNSTRTFGVVIDTSSSMSQQQLGLALGAIASYANAKDVPVVRIVFCDANAYDAGYITPDELVGKVKITGRGGTVLQPAITLLEKAKDFPADAPILIITDGYIEEKLIVKCDHAFLLPKGNRLPFIPKGEVFYFKNRLQNISR